MLVSHEQATVERGFSVNRQMEVENLHEESGCTAVDMRPYQQCWWYTQGGCIQSTTGVISICKTKIHGKPRRAKNNQRKGKMCLMK